MSVQLRRRRDKAAFLATYVGAGGELIVDTDNNRVQVHDGVTPGGFSAARIDEVALLRFVRLSDADYTIQAADFTVALVTALTASRTLTLPAASSVKPGKSIRITDQAGGVSSTNKLTVAVTGTDKLNGAAASVFAAPFTDFSIVSDGVAAWTYDIQGVARGGTGGTTAASARANLGAAASGANSDITSIAGLTTALSVGQGGTGATTASGSRSNLGAAASGANSDITALTGLTTPLSVGQGGTGASTAGGARGNIGAAASGANSDITSISGLTTALSIAQGGTGGATAASARSGLGAAASGANTDITSVALTGGTMTGVTGTFIGPFGVTNTGTACNLNLSATGNGTDQKYIRLAVTTNGLFLVQAVSDDQATVTTLLTTTRSGSLTTAANVTAGGTLTVNGLATFGSTLGLKVYTVATLPAPGTIGRMVYCSNARVFNGAGVQEASGSGTGGIVSDTGAAWRIAGTNIAAAA